MTEPTPEQLDNLLDRAERHALSTAEAQLLCTTVRRLVAERDRWRRGYDHHYQRAERAEEADQRVRDLCRARIVSDRRGERVSEVLWPHEVLAALDNREPK